MKCKSEIWFEINWAICPLLNQVGGESQLRGTEFFRGRLTTYQLHIGLSVAQLQREATVVTQSCSTLPEHSGLCPVARWAVQVRTPCACKLALWSTSGSSRTLISEKWKETRLPCTSGCCPITGRRSLRRACPGAWALLLSLHTFNLSGIRWWPVLFSCTSCWYTTVYPFAFNLSNPFVLGGFSMQQSWFCFVIQPGIFFF